MPSASSPSLLPPIVLSFDASDPTCGGGLQADLLTLAAFGVHPLSVITALSVRDTGGAEGALVIDDDWVVDQARVLLEDMRVQAFKIGALGSMENAAAVAEVISDYPDVPVVLEPVLRAGGDDPLADEDLTAAVVDLLLPLTTVLCLGSGQLRRLAQDEDEEELELADCAARLLEAGAEYVLVSGSHENTPQVINTLFGHAGLVRSDTWERLPGAYHGAGSTLTAALAAGLARGLRVVDAAHAAQAYTWDALAHAFRPGMGQQLPDRFWRLRDA